MKLDIVQLFRSPAPAVASALTDPALYPCLGDLPRISAPVVLDVERQGDRTTIRVRYRFSGELSAPARRVLDPDRLTWVEESVFDHSTLGATFAMVPDHYRDRFHCAGSFRLQPTPTGCERHAAIDLQVRVPIVGRSVEGAIASGLRSHLSHEVDLIEAYIERTVTP